MADARLAAQYDEAVTNGTPAKRLGAISYEALTDSQTVPQRRLAAITYEAMTTAVQVPQRRLGAVAIEVLVPRKFVQVGWGVPL